MAMIRLNKMTQFEFDAYYPRALQRLADELGKARDLSPSKALELAKKSFDGLFPDGRIDVADQFIYNIDSNGTRVGVLHLGIRRDGKHSEAYVWDIEIQAAHRSQGHGKSAMLALEKVVGELGLKKITLNVFGHNTPAIELYRRLSYRPIAMTMTKVVESNEIE